jgi:erythromycin esterase-like protein
MARLAADPVAEIAAVARPWGQPGDLDALMERIGEAQYVLLGEASHGTSQYYAWRARISQRLISEKGFSFIAVEGDWPDCYRVNRYVKHYPASGSSAREVLEAYRRWPTWMWANREMLPLIEWLRRHNARLEPDRRAGFYGLDVYSLWDSIRAVVDYLEAVDPAAAAEARQAYRCFEPFSDVNAYAYHTAFVPESCEAEVLRILQQLRQNAPRYDGDYEAVFDAQQNARITVNAERYYRTMVRGDAASWNIRDHHMNETLTHLMERYGPQAKAIVWAHNTHVGDARYTDMVDSGMVNIGQLVREEQTEDNTVLVGFGSYQGTVIAGEAWDAPAEVMTVPPARQDSWEALMHQAAPTDKLILSDETEHHDEFWQIRDHRAIGVVYHPGRERFGNYVSTLLPERYDAFIYLDKTRALRPLHDETGRDDDVPETYPWGM